MEFAAEGFDEVEEPGFQQSQPASSSSTANGVNAHTSTSNGSSDQGAASWSSNGQQTSDEIVQKHSSDTQANGSGEGSNSNDDDLIYTGRQMPVFPIQPKRELQHVTSTASRPPVASPSATGDYARYAQQNYGARPYAAQNGHPQPVLPAPGYTSNMGRIPVVNGSNARYPTNGGFSGYAHPHPGYGPPLASPIYGRAPQPQYGYPSQPGSASISSPHPPSSQVSTRQSSQKTSSQVIDLTEGDDASDSEGSDEVTVKAEKIPPPKAEEDEDNDDLQIVSETKTEATAPICIGQITGVALILYPISELTAIPPASTAAALTQPPPPMRILMNRSAQQFHNGLSNETVKLYSANTKENFGVLEHRLANVLGPLMTRDNRRGRGIWMEAWVLRTRERNPMMLQLLMLLFCHPQVVQHVSAQLEKNTIYLQHPVSYEPSVHGGFKYYNPHGSMYQSADAERRRREVMSGLGGTYTARYPAQAPKSVEVQREQVEDMFKSMKSGADLGEADPDPAVSTQMYPHQKQALAFLLDREKLRDTDNLKVKKKEMTEAIDQEDDTNMISLWKPRRDMYGRFVGWHNVVTEVECGNDRPPPQCRGAILADDMGLGKTIVIIALIATTKFEAKLFSAGTPTKDRLGASFDALAAHPVGKQAGQAISLANSGFSTPIFGKTNGVSTQDVLTGMKGGAKGKKKGESKTQKKREELEEARLKKLKMRSRGTLIVCPLSTVVNWESQLDEHIGISSSTVTRKRRGDDSGTSTPTQTVGLSVYIYHGNNRTSDLATLADHDVVITTFSTLGSEYSRQARKEEQDEEGSSSSDGGIEELDADGQPVKQKGKKRKRKKIEGNADSALQQIEWFRVVLDEAHMIKEHTTIQARACCALMAERRVCLTGTPVQNSLNDLFSLLRFLRLEPFTDRGIWSSYVGSPCKVGDPLGVSRLQLIMRHLALRRTKNSTDKEGKPILSIPPKKDEIKYLQLDEQEKAFYSAHHRRYKHNFEMLERSDTLLKNYCSILQEVLRLRQICAHMGLVRDSEDRADLAKGDDAGDVVSAIKAHGISKRRALRLLALMRDTGAAQCGECGLELASGGLSTTQDPDEEDGSKDRKKKARSSRRTVKEENDVVDNATTQTPILTKCQHLFCLECFKTNICPKFPNISATDRSTCSICREEISPVIDAVQISASDIDSLGAGDGDEDTTTKRGSRTIEHSTKIRALVSDLFPLSQNNPASANYAGGTVDLTIVDEDEQFRPQPNESIKTVIFSQWTALLDRCEDALHECRIKFTRLDGGMSRPERTRALNSFKNDLSVEVMLISLRAGGVGLNLTHASRVYILEPSWNPSVENQAVDRCHRLGQVRPVKVSRLIVQDSIEANMLQIQKRKIDLANLSLSQTLSKAQLAERRLEDLRTLFK